LQDRAQHSMACVSRKGEEYSGARMTTTMHGQNTGRLSLWPQTTCCEQPSQSRLPAIRHDAATKHPICTAPRTTPAHDAPAFAGRALLPRQDVHVVCAHQPRAHAGLALLQHSVQLRRLRALSASLNRPITARHTYTQQRQATGSVQWVLPAAATRQGSKHT
jgi:hypothetical protein